jgi:hypothetical protein
LSSGHLDAAKRALMFMLQPHSQHFITLFWVVELEHARHVLNLAASFDDVKRLAPERKMSAIVFVNNYFTSAVNEVRGPSNFSNSAIESRTDCLLIADGANAANPSHPTIALPPEKPIKVGKILGYNLTTDKSASFWQVTHENVNSLYLKLQKTDSVSGIWAPIAAANSHSRRRHTSHPIKPIPRSKFLLVRFFCSFSN